MYVVPFGAQDIHEFSRLLQLLNPSPLTPHSCGHALPQGTWSEERLQRFFSRADKDGSGRVDLQETLDWLLYGARRKAPAVPPPEAKPRPPEIDTEAELAEMAKKRRSSEVSRIMRLASKT